MRQTLILAMMILFSVSTAYSAEEGMQMKKVQESAVRSMGEFSSLVMKQKNYREMGFESADDLKRMALGEPLQSFTVRLDHLQKYEKGMNPEELISGGRHYMYPLQVDKQVRSSLAVAEVKGEWKAVSFGSPNLIKMLSNTRMKSAEMSGAVPSSYFVVEIPSLNLFMLGNRIEGKLMLSPVSDNPKLGFKEGTPMNAEDVFLALVPLARAHDGLPR